MDSKHTTTQLMLDFDSGVEVAPEPPANNPQRLLSITACDVERSQRTASTLRARNDSDAIAAWVAAKCNDAGRDQAGRPAHTALAYTREARRFLLWLQVERKTSLTEASLEDCIECRRFLANPQPRERWCAPRGATVGTAEWRPFAGPLSARSCRQAMTILSGLFGFLQDQQYRVGNPWSGVSMPRNSTPRIDTGRSLTRSQWLAVECELREGPKDLRSKQLAWAINFLYLTGLRLAEVSSANCSDLRRVELEDAADDWSKTELAAIPAAWLIRVCGKGLKIRDVPIPSNVVAELGEILTATGLSNDPRLHRGRPLLIAMRSFGTGALGAGCRRLSAQTSRAGTADPEQSFDFSFWAP